MAACILRRSAVLRPSVERPLASVQEFKVDNSTFSAEHGHVSRAIVNLVTRSGTVAWAVTSH
jgi:hypothetical protein